MAHWGGAEEIEKKVPEALLEKTHAKGSWGGNLF